MTAENSFYTIKDEKCCEYEEKHSRFLAYSKLVRSEEDVREYLDLLHIGHPDATHICYAFVLGQHGEISRNNDDGEPSGSAGVPILDSIKKNGLTNTLVAVVRYFGGKELGVSKLYKAYNKTALSVIKAAGFFTMTECSIYEFRFSYNDFGKVGGYFRDNELPIMKQDYSDIVRVEIAIPVQREQKTFSELKTRLGGSFINNKLRNSFIRFTDEK